MMNGHEKSDPAIVAMKPTNKAEPSAERSAGVPCAAESVEQRAGTKGNAGQQSTRRTQSRISVSQALERIRGGSRMRESRTYGSVRGVRDETRVPTATRARVHHVSGNYETNPPQKNTSNLADFHSRQSHYFLVIGMMLWAAAAYFLRSVHYPWHPRLCVDDLVGAGLAGLARCPVLVLASSEDCCRYLVRSARLTTAYMRPMASGLRRVQMLIASAIADCRKRLVLIAPDAQAIFCRRRHHPSQATGPPTSGSGSYVRSVRASSISAIAIMT